MGSTIDRLTLTMAFRDAGIRFFTGTEYMASMGSVDLPAELLGNAIRICTFADRVRAYMGEPLVLTSGWRSAEVNRRVGGAPTSSHVNGSAVDLRVNRPTLRPSANANLRRAGALAWIGLPNELAGFGFYFGNIHLDLLGTDNEKGRRFWAHVPSKSNPKPGALARARLAWFAEIRGTITQPAALEELGMG